MWEFVRWRHKLKHLKISGKEDLATQPPTLRLPVGMGRIYLRP